jgi:hypothetical protein
MSRNVAWLPLATILPSLILVIASWLLAAFARPVKIFGFLDRVFGKARFPHFIWILSSLQKTKNFDDVVYRTAP